MGADFYIEAFTESKAKIWTHHLFIRDSTYHEKGQVLVINSPNIAYNLDEYFIGSIGDRELLCIDAGGRNYGVDESVYVNTQDLVNFLKQEGLLNG